MALETRRDTTTWSHKKLARRSQSLRGLVGGHACVPFVPVGRTDPVQGCVPFLRGSCRALDIYEYRMFKDCIDAREQH